MLGDPAVVEVVLVVVVVAAEEEVVVVGVVVAVGVAVVSRSVRLAGKTQWDGSLGCLGCW